MYGIEPATFRLVVQRLNHCATAVPSTGVLNNNIIEFNLTFRHRASSI